MERARSNEEAQHSLAAAFISPTPQESTDAAPNGSPRSGRAAEGFSSDLPFKYYYTGRKPMMHPSGRGNIYTELVDGLGSGTTDLNWEAVVFERSIDDLRILLQWSEPSVVKDIVVHYTNSYRNYGFSKVKVFISTDGVDYRLFDALTTDEHLGQGTLTIPIGLLIPQVELVFQNRDYWRSILLNEITLSGYPLGRTDFSTIQDLYRNSMTKFSQLPIDDSFDRNRILTGLDYIQQEEFNSFRLLNIPTNAYREPSLDTYFKVRAAAERLIPGSEQLSDGAFLERWLTFVEDNVEVEEFDEWNVLNFLTTGRTACGISAQFAGFLKAFGFSTARRIGWQSNKVEGEYWKGFTEVFVDSKWHLVDFSQFRILDESVFEFYRLHPGRKAPIEFDVYPPYANYFLPRGIDIQGLSEHHRLLLSRGGTCINAEDFPPFRSMW
jgi:hypothetical protein